MRYFLLLISLVAILIASPSCSPGRNLSADEVVKNSIWISSTPAEMDGEQGTVINSIYFTDGNQVFMKTGVAQDSTIVKAPIFSGYGTYTISGTLNKGIKVSIQPDVVTIGKKTIMEGVITPDGMILIEPDHTASIYHKVQTSK